MAACTAARAAADSIRTSRKVSLARHLAQRFSSSLRRDGFARFTAVVSYASVAIGCIAVILAMSILEGYEQVVRSTMMRFAAPIEVRSLMQSVLDLESTNVVQHLRSVEGIGAVEIQRSREALGRSRSGVDGILLVGSTAAQAQLRIAPILQQGAVPASSDHAMPHVAIGVGVAQRLLLSVGDTMIVYTATAQNTAPLIAPVRVVGVFQSGMQQYDETAVVMPMASLTTLLRMPSAVATSIAVYPTSITDVEVVAARMRTKLGRKDGLYVQTYRERFASIESWIALQQRPIPIILGLISLVAVFTVVAILLITVVEKRRQIAVLRVMGMRSRTIAAVFLWRGFTVGLIGWCIGSVLSLGFCVVQDVWKPIALDGAIYYVSALPVAFSWQPYAIVAATSICTSLLASVLPVVIATRIHPVAALRFD